MASSQRESLALPFAEAVVADAPLEDRLPFSLFDIVWFALAISTAWKIGSGEFYREP